MCSIHSASVKTIRRLDFNTEMCHVQSQFVTLYVPRGSSKFVNVINVRRLKLTNLLMSETEMKNRKTEYFKTYQLFTSNIVRSVATLLGRY